MNNIETIKLALEALESCGWNDGYAGKTQYFHDELVDKAIATLRQAIDQTQQAEPVAWRYRGNLHEFDPSDWAEGPVTPLYTTPPQRKPWVGLTDEEILNIEETTTCTGNESWLRNLTHNIEAKLRSKNEY